MKIMGIDTSIKPGNEGSVISIVILSKGEIISAHTLDVCEINDNLCNMIIDEFKLYDCEHLAMDISGVNIQLYEQISKYLPEWKLKCISYKQEDINDLIIRLSEYKSLNNKINIELSYEINPVNGICKLSYDNIYSMTLVYAVGVANNEYCKLIQ